MCPPNDPTPANAELLEQYVLGTLSAHAREALEARLAMDSQLAEELEGTRRACSAMRAALAEAHVASDLTNTDADYAALVAYLDDALSEDERYDLEVRLESEPALLSRLTALFLENETVTNENSAVELTEKFLAGDTLPFETRESAITQSETTSYESLESAVEERKRRYMQSGN